jgi:hypothetical protein
MEQSENHNLLMTTLAVEDEEVDAIPWLQERILSLGLHTQDAQRKSLANRCKKPHASHTTLFHLRT